MPKISNRQLLKRVNLEIPLEQLAEQIANEFNLGSLLSFAPLPVGYEELNSLLTTDKGKFIVKIFSQDKTLSVINSNITSLIEYDRGGVPVPKLHPDKSGNYLYRIKDNPEAYLIVMDYFEGKKFTEIEPTEPDVVNLTKILAKIHRLKFETKANFDSWLTIYLAKEFAEKQQYLSPENRQLIEPVVNRFKSINYSRLTKSIVHFDLHRENAMKDGRGNYCILDLASTDFNYKVFDLATFMALFCLDGKKTLKENKTIYQLAVKTYTKEQQLNDYEQEILPLLIQATFASNLLIPEYLQKTGQDASPEQTIYYKSMGKNGLKLLQNNTSKVL